MPWNEQERHGGFSTAEKPWLPVAAEHLPLAVTQQENDPHSTLNQFTRLLHWRRSQPALVHGSMTLLPSNPQALAFVREHASECLLCVFNFSEQPLQWAVPVNWEAATLLTGSGLEGAQLHGGFLHLEPWSAAHLSN